MEILLRNDFTAHYGLSASTTANISLRINEVYFEIEDDASRETIIHYIPGTGTAKYRNLNNQNVTIINFDKFITGLSSVFQKGKDRCDLILHTNNNGRFLLNELTDTAPKYVADFNNKVGKRNKATSQLVSSLELVMAVPAINTFVNLHAVKQCCFFNKQSMAPPLITATTAFGRLNAITPSGLQMPNPSIEAFGFEFWEYSGGQVYNL